MKPMRPAQPMQPETENLLKSLAVGNVCSEHEYIDGVKSDVAVRVHAENKEQAERIAMKSVNPYLGSSGVDTTDDRVEEMETCIHADSKCVLPYTREVGK